MGYAPTGGSAPLGVGYWCGVDPEGRAWGLVRGVRILHSDPDGRRFAPLTMGGGRGDRDEPVVHARPYGLAMSEPIVYLAHERPDVEVLWEGVWCLGELRMQRQDGACQWLCQVQYRRRVS